LPFCIGFIDYAISPDILDTQPLRSYVVILFSFFIAPAIWPFVLVNALRWLERWGIIQPQAKTSWDHFFNNIRRGSFVVVHLPDGSYMGGKFGVNSYASGYPDSGHLYLEELWEVGADGNFTGKVLEGQGVILRPTDYKYVRVST
jgi:hypothetical protein